MEGDEDLLTQMAMTSSRQKLTLKAIRTFLGKAIARTFTAFKQNELQSFDSDVERVK